MQDMSLDETANVSWVDAVVTKGFAPEETHSQQIPTWTISDYTLTKAPHLITPELWAANGPGTSQPDTLSLAPWGRDLDVHFTLGVRDMEGIKLARDEGYRMCLAADNPWLGTGNNRNGDMSFQDTFFPSDYGGGGYRGEYHLELLRL